MGVRCHLLLCWMITRPGESGWITSRAVWGGPAQLYGLGAKRFPRLPDCILGVTTRVTGLCISTAKMVTLIAHGPSFRLFKVTVSTTQDQVQRHNKEQQHALQHSWVLEQFKLQGKQTLISDLGRNGIRDKPIFYYSVVINKCIYW